MLMINDSNDSRAALARKRNRFDPLLQRMTDQRAEDAIDSMSRCIMLCYAILYYIMLCSIILCYTMINY